MRFLSAFLFLLASKAHAEYRMFLLEITAADGSVRQVRSTLDPDQYPGYFPLKEGEKIKYADTWMCRGRTDNVPPCKSPRETASESDSQASSPP